VRLTGWQKIKKKWYYFSKKTGVMLKNRKVGKYTLNADGVCTNR
jgi:glucan-binding YG repeat protein